MKKTVLLILGLIYSLTTLAQNAPTQESPKNIILLIGDGMGVSQISTAFYFNDDSVNNFMRFPVVGLIKTSSASDKITDSAAGATAFSAGACTYNGAIGVDTDTASVPTIVEILAEQGLSTGLIATSSITHATPAAFYAHVASRDMQDEIARQLVHAPVDFFAGGGNQFFSHREDSVNYLDSLQAQGFLLDTTQLASPDTLSKDQKYAYLMAPDGMPRMTEQRGDFLPKATQMALDHLSQNDKGFFLMVEGSQIDWGGHANDAEYIITEVADFDKTLGVALDFAEKNKNTLVVVTADHETGGFALSSTDNNDHTYSDYNKITPTFSTGGHTATLIPVFAFGPGAQLFGGIYKNTDIFKKMIEAHEPREVSASQE